MLPPHNLSLTNLFIMLSCEYILIFLTGSEKGIPAAATEGYHSAQGRSSSSNCADGLQLGKGECVACKLALSVKHKLIEVKRTNWK